VTGIDIVQWQLRIAAGEKLPFVQSAIVPRGWAIECRITSEDPANGFLPSTGRVTYLHVPAGPGVRWDGGIETGSQIGLFYDPLLAKLIVWAPTRDAAIARMHRALLELTIDGIDSSRDFQLRVMEDDEFRRGAIEIQWLERRLPSLINVAPPPRGTRTAAIAAALLAAAERSGRAPGTSAATDRTSPSAVQAATDGAQASESWADAARREGLRW
jgi:acetyl-CoA carboxylase biotin carboxylase subunit